MATGAAAMKWLVLCTTLGACIAAQAQAPDVTELDKVDALQGIRAGQPTKVTIRSGANPSRWCGLRVDFGDGQVRDVKIGPDIFFPVTLDVTYARPGNFTLRAVGARVTTRPPCAGALTIGVPVTPVVVAAALSPTTDASQCPQTVALRNASGETVSFGLAQMVRESGGLAAARELVARRIIDTQDRALDDKLAASERETAKRYAESLKSVREHLGACR